MQYLVTSTTPESAAILFWPHSFTGRKLSTRPWCSTWVSHTATRHSSSSTVEKERFFSTVFRSRYYLIEKKIMNYLLILLLSDYWLTSSNCDQIISFNSSNIAHIAKVQFHITAVIRLWKKDGAGVSIGHKVQTIL